jgi:hypothetical protein
MNIVDQDHERLLRRDIEEDTRILSTKYFRANGIPFLMEKWTWEGVRGMTAVFLTQHVSKMDDAALTQFLNEQAGLDIAVSGITMVRQEEHTFLNFGFGAE